MSYRTAPSNTSRMPSGIPWIIGNEAAERFSFYGMRTILVVFMAQYLHLMDGHVAKAMSQSKAVEHYHQFASWVYFTPLLGALLADVFLGKYRTIMLLSVVYCIGHAVLACMGSFGNSPMWLMAGLGLICLGSGGIKPCVSAHVGDQFGPNNSHLLTRIYHWFYFAINAGSFFSTLLTPWLLEHYGPHWAFGVPGVLMAIATVMFWVGRHQFVHVPAAGWGFFRELFSRDGIAALLKLVPLFGFIAIFWALYDQTGSSWVFQAQDMDLRFLGITWLASQVQAVNPILILAFIPVFALMVYPAINRVFKLTPLRKIGIGFFLTFAAFAVTTLVQTWIDAGQRPNIGWQLLAFVLITAGEIMVSIVGLEFAYTQSPKSMKSMIMSLYLLAVWLGNQLTAQVNHAIQVPSATSEQLAAAIAQLPHDWQKDPRNVVLPGYDGITGTDDDFIQRIEGGTPGKLELANPEVYQQAAAAIEQAARANQHKLPAPAQAAALLADLRDAWGNPLRYEVINASSFRIAGDGPEKKSDSKWRTGFIVTVETPEDINADAWLEKQKRKLGVAARNATQETAYVREAFCGGQNRLSGAAYFRFFSVLMLGTLLAYIPFALIYRPKTYLHGES